MRLFGFGKSDTRLDQAAAYVEEVGESGFTRHYSAGAIQDSVRQFAGVDISEAEAVTLVQNYRASKGRNPLPQSVFYPDQD